MSWIRRLFNSMRPNRVSRDIDREMSFHLAERVDALRDSGMSAGEAEGEARRRFGNRTLVSEHVRAADASPWLDATLTDIRYAARALLKSPGFSVVAILSLAFGIGANTAVFSLTNALLLKTLPVAQPERLLHVYMDTASNANFSNPLWEQIRDQTSDIAGSVAHAVTSFNIERTGLERRANGAWVSGDFFSVLGVPAVAGRLIAHSDDVRGCPGVAAVSEGFAIREFGGAANATGKTLSLNGEPVAVIGVSDGRFFGLEVGRTSDIFVPLCAQVTFYGAKVLDHRGRWYLDILLRPHAGIDALQVAARLAGISHGAFASTLPPNYSAADQSDYLKTKLGSESGATGLSDLRQAYGFALITLMAIVAVVLVVACANIANLLLARAAARQREIAIRLAIGAGRRRLVRQLLTESLVLATIGAGLGVVFAQWASRLLVTYLSTAARPVFLDLSLDGRVLAFTSLVAVATVALFGLAPAWRAARVDPQLAMKAGGRGVAGGSAQHRLGRSLVVIQVALSLALVTASGLLLGSFRRLITLDPGFRRDGVTIATLKFRNARYAPEALLGVKRDVLARLRAVPGVMSASASVLTPIGSMGWNEAVSVDGRVPTDARAALADMNEVGEDYFATLGTAFLAGRDFTAADIEQHRPVALINQTMAHHFFGDVSPLGKSFRLTVGDTLGPAHEIIGVVQDAKYRRLSETFPATGYLPMGQSDFEGDQMQFEIRSAVPFATMVPAIRALAAAVNPAISLEVTTLDQQVSASLTRPRILATLSTFFGGLALLLAVLGLYGTMSYNVTRRKSEIGIRMALGAAGAGVMRMVAGEAAALIVVGIVVGAGLAFATTRLVGTFLYGMTATDPATFLFSAAALAVVAMAAAIFPALRAAAQDPVAVLRED